MEIPLFPQLTVALRTALGYGPHVDMLQHFCYWMHPRHPKMQNRWEIYKTYKEWREECGLSDRQVRKGRKVLRELGLTTEKKSNYVRIDYRVDWVALARALSLDVITVQADEDLDDFDFFDDDDSLDAITVQGQFGHYSDQSSLDAITEQPNAGVHAPNYEQNNYSLQRAAEPAFAEPAAPEINKEEPKEVDLSSSPDDSKRHSQIAEPPKPEISREVQFRALGYIFGLPNETDATRFADHHIAGKVDADGEAFTVERVAEKVRELLGGDEPLEAYMPWVERCLKDKRDEATRIEAAS